MRALSALYKLLSKSGTAAKDVGEGVVFQSKLLGRDVAQGVSDTRYIPDDLRRALGIAQKDPLEGGMLPRFTEADPYTYQNAYNTTFGPTLRSSQSAELGPDVQAAVARFRSMGIPDEKIVDLLNQLDSVPPPAPTIMHRGR